MAARPFPDRIRVTNAHPNPEAAADLSGFASFTQTLERVASDPDFGTSAARLPSITGQGILVLWNADGTRFAVAPNQVFYVRVEVKKRGPGTVRLVVNIHVANGDLHSGTGMDSGSVNVATHPSLADDEVYTLEGFHRLAPVASTTAYPLVILDDGVDSELLVTRVQIVPNAQGDVPVYVTTPTEVEVPSPSLRGTSDSGQTSTLLPPPEAAHIQREFGFNVMRSAPDNALITAAVTDWGAHPYDAYMQAWRDLGMKLIYVVGVPTYFVGGLGDVSPYSLQPADYAAWADHHASFLDHYKDMIVAVEWFNEPNHGMFWGYGSGANRAPDPAKYTAQLQALYPALKAVAPSIPVMAASLTPVAVTDLAAPLPMMSCVEFLNGMYSAGAKGYMDALSIHPYPLGATTADWGGVDKLGFDEFLWQMREIMATNTDPLPLWFTEIGLNVADCADSEHVHANALRLLFGIAERQPDVESVCLHAWSSETDNEGGYVLMPMDTRRRRIAASKFVARDVVIS